MTASVDIDVSLKLAQFEAQMKAMRGSMDEFGRSAKKNAATVNSAFAGIKGVAAGLVAELSIEAFKNAVEGTLDWADSLAETSAKLGVTAEQLQRVQSLGIGFNSSTEGMTNAFKNFNNVLGLAAVGNAKAQKSIGLLGDEFENLSKSGASSDQVFLSAVNAISQYDDAATRAAVANKVLGDGGDDIVQGFRDSGKTIDEFAKSLTDLNVVSNDAVQRGAELNDKWQELSKSTGLFFKSEILQFTDFVTAMFQQSESYVKKVSDWWNGIESHPNDAAATQAGALPPKRKSNPLGKPLGAGTLGKEEGAGSSGAKLESKLETLVDLIYYKETRRGTNPNTWKKHMEAGGLVTGPMQIQESTFNRFAQPGEQWLSTDGQMKVGKRILKHLLDKYDGDTVKAAAGYFGGEGTVDKAINKGGNFIGNLPKLTKEYALDYAKLEGQANQSGSSAATDISRTQEKLLEDRQRAAEKLQATLRGFSIDKEAAGLPELEAKKIQELNQALEANDLVKDKLTGTEQKYKAEIVAGIEAKYSELQAQKDLEDSYKNSIADQELLALRQEELAKTAEDYQTVIDGIVTDSQFEDMLARLNDLYREGVINMDTYGKATTKLGEEFRKSQDVAKDSTDKMSEFAKSAARNMESGLADFLFDPFKDGLDGMVTGFATTIQRMMAELAASAIMDWAKNGLSSLASSGGDSGGGWAGMLSSVIGAFSSHADGIANMPKDGMVKVHKDEAIIPAKFNRLGISPYGHNEGSGGIVVNQNITVQSGASSQDVKRAAGQGAREVLGVVNKSQRYG
jgi:hypothetical protein